MAKYWYSYITTDPNAPARLQTSNYVYTKGPQSCGAQTTRPCDIFATAPASGTPVENISHPSGTTLSTNLTNYFTAAIGVVQKYPTSKPFVYLKV